MARLLPCALTALITTLLRPATAFPFFTFTEPGNFLEAKAIVEADGAVQEVVARQGIVREHRDEGHGASVADEAQDPDDTAEIVKEAISYLYKKDAVFNWTDTGTRRSGMIQVGSSKVNYTCYVLNVTSQKFLTPEESNRPVWWHTLSIVVPSAIPGGPVPPDFGALLVGGTAHDMKDYWTTNNLDYGKDEDLTAAIDMAVNSGVVTASLTMVPNQPIVFAQDPMKIPRSEDAYTSYSANIFTFVDRNRTDRWDYLFCMPMLKAVLRAMDVMTAFSKQTLSAPIEKFAVSGMSKRGRASWQAAFIDPRVSAVLPGVLPFNMTAQFDRSFMSLGGYEFALKDYVQIMKASSQKNAASDASPGLTPDQMSSAFEAAFIQDGINWADKIAPPKFVMLALDDEFFLPDATTSYWDKLPANKHLFVLPNSPHIGTPSMADFLPAMASYTRAVALKKKLPELEWSINQTTGAIFAKMVSGMPTKVSQWTAETCGNARRDFRFVNMDEGANCTRCGKPLQPGAGPKCLNLHINWQEKVVQEITPGSGTWLAEVTPPADGSWAAFVLMFEYPGHGALPFKLTTEASIVPMTYAAASCPSGQLCNEGKLVLGQQDMHPMMPHWDVPEVRRIRA